MSYNKISDLVKKIYQKSNEGSISWVQTEEDSKYQVSFSNYSVRIFPERREGQLDYVVQIINSNGDVVEEVSDVDLKDILSNAYVVMKQIHEIARRQAMGVEDALDSILNELDEPDFF